MKLIAIMPVRNESWCLGLTARAALMWCDELVVGLHACEDNSETILYDIELNETRGRLHAIDLPGDSWDEMAHRQMLLDEARAHGATHIALVDADEILTGDLVTVFGNAAIRTQTYAYPRQGHLLQLPLYNLRGGIASYHANGLWGNRIVSVAFTDDPALGWHGDRFHHREPMGKELTRFQPIAQGEGGVMHLWGASEERLLAKHALYKVTERLRWPEKPVSEIDQTYSMCIKGAIREDASKWRYSVAPDSWWEPYGDLAEKYLDLRQTPWQIAEVRRLAAQHGRRFAGLDLFGIV